MRLKDVPAEDFDVRWPWPSAHEEAWDRRLAFQRARIERRFSDLSELLELGLRLRARLEAEQGAVGTPDAGGVLPGPGHLRLVGRGRT